MMVTAHGDSGTASQFRRGTVTQAIEMELLEGANILLKLFVFLNLFSFEYKMIPFMRVLFFKNRSCS